MDGQYDGDPGGRATGAEQQFEQRFQETDPWRTQAALMPRLHKKWRMPARADVRQNTDPKPSLPRDRDDPKPRVVGEI